MKRTLQIIALGITASFCAEVLYFDANKPCGDDSLECQLSWIQDYLNLSPEQFETVVAMHRDRQPEVRRLQEKVQSLESRLAALEDERINNDSIDFLAFYNYLQEKVTLDETRDSSTESFLTRVEDVMDANQRERFQNLIKEFKSRTKTESQI
ncbi:MAG: hypothetical protein KJT03_17235 [Verrucomicrobiae bacterium]|nr:hypothetical protein [Verrucomicrobiae bacterium]